TKFPKYLATELKIRFRTPVSVFFIFVFPIFLMIVFAESFGKQMPNYIPENIALIMFYAVLSASVVSFSTDISRYKGDNFYFLLERRAGNKFVYLLAQLVSFVLIIFLSTLAILAVAHYRYSYVLPDLNTLLLFYGKLYLYASPFFLLSIIIGFASKNASMASAVATPLMFISYFLGGMMVPYIGLSGTMKTISGHFFLTQLLSDLTHTLTQTYTVKPNWSLVALSVGAIVLVAFFVLRNSGFVRK
ncbi:MAG: ABC transporter permease, partial [Streptococcaceae bacterium]|nr:ABC transporter permease [Streptococcaceae bacterium]